MDKIEVEYNRDWKGKKRLNAEEIERALIEEIKKAMSEYIGFADLFLVSSGDEDSKEKEKKRILELRGKWVGLVDFAEKKLGLITPRIANIR